MKKFVLELLGSVFTALVVIPTALIGLGIGGTIWEKKVDPWLKTKFKDQKEETLE